MPRESNRAIDDEKGVFAHTKVKGKAEKFSRNAFWQDEKQQERNTDIALLFRLGSGITETIRSPIV